MRLALLALGIAVGVLLSRRPRPDAWQTLWQRDTVDASKRLAAIGFDYDYLT